MLAECRFEHMALEYDEDEIGEMDEQEGDIRGPATLDDFRGIIAEFHATHSQSQSAYEVCAACTARLYPAAAPAAAWLCGWGHAGYSFSVCPSWLGP